VTRRAGVALVINDHLSVAQEVGAEFAIWARMIFFGAGRTHISQLRTGIARWCARGAAARRLACLNSGLGLSSAAPRTGGPAPSLRARITGPFGPVYPTGTKPTAKPVTLEYVRWARGEYPKFPGWPSGVINFVESGRRAWLRAPSEFAWVSAILNEDDLAAACRRFKDRLPPVRPAL